MSNIVINGGFDASPLPAPWVFSGVALGNQVTTAVYYQLANKTGTGPNLPDSPTRSYQFSLLNLGTLGQTGIIAVPGAQYRLSFALRSNPGLLNLSSMTVSLTNSTLPPGVSIGLNLLGTSGLWQTFQYDFFATGTTMTLNFSTVGVTLGGNVNLDAVSIVMLAAPCFTGESMIRTRNICTNEIADVPAYRTFSDMYEVFMSDTEEFVPIIHNAKSRKETRFFLFSKDTYGKGKPYEDFYVTSGHRMIVDGVNVKARRARGGKKVKINPTHLHTIVTQKGGPLLINGLQVMAYDLEGFNSFVDSKQISWIDVRSDDDNPTCNQGSVRLDISHKQSNNNKPIKVSTVNIPTILGGLLLFSLAVYFIGGWSIIN